MRSRKSLYKDLFSYTRTAGLHFVLKAVLPLLFIFILAFQLDSSLTTSISLEMFLDGYHHTSYKEFVRNHPSVIHFLKHTILVLFILYFLIANYANTAALHNVVNSTDTTREFFGGGKTYFWPCLIVSVCFLLFLVVWSLLLMAPPAAMFNSATEIFDTEVPYVWLCFSMFGFYVFGLILMVGMSTYWKSEIIRSGNWKGSFAAAWSMFKSSFFKVLRVGFICLLVLAVLFYFLRLFSCVIDESNLIWILVMVAVQLAFMWVKSMVRTAYFNGLVHTSPG